MAQMPCPSGQTERGRSSHVSLHSACHWILEAGSVGDSCGLKIERQSVTRLATLNFINVAIHLDFWLG